MKKEKEINVEEKWQYDAFISYRHMQPDSFVAQTLHRCLENFRLPRNVARRKGKENAEENAGENGADQVRTRIRRVFRDKEELPLVSNLADPITEALEQSEYLIVICSPRLNESIWCRKEIETFIRMHDREHVLAVLAEGEPEISFPEELLFREEEEHKPDGSVIYHKIPVEPLAADVRGSTRREMRRKIKSELLRLAAPMFDCSYDDLRQRHREQRMRKVIVTSVSVSVLCLLIGLVSTAAALKIQRQSRQIKEDAELIYEQAGVIEKQYEEIEDQYAESQRRVTEAYAREALGYLEEGDRMRGLTVGVMAYEEYREKSADKEQEAETPPQLTYALTELLRLYENGEQIKPDRTLEANSTIRYMKVSPKGSRVMAVGDSGRLTVWESLHDRSSRSFRPEGVNLSWECQVGFMSEDKILYPQETEDAGEEVCVQDLESYEVTTYPSVCFEGVIPIPEKEAFLVVEEEGCYLVGADGKAADRLQWEMLEAGLYAKVGFEAEQMVTEDGRILIALELTSRSGDDKRIAVLAYPADAGQQPETSLYAIDYDYIGGLCLEKGSYQHGADLLYVIGNQAERTDQETVTAGMSGRLQAFDLSGQRELWRYEISDGWFYDVSFAHREGSSYLLCQRYSDALLLDRKDGTLIDTFSFGTEIVEIGSYTNTDDFMAFTRDGIWHYLDTDYRADMVGSVFSDCTSSNVKAFAMGDGYCVTLPYGSNRITVYQRAIGEGVETFYEGEDIYREAALSGDGKLLAVRKLDDSFSTSVDIFDTAKKKLLRTYEDSAFFEAMAFGNFGEDETELLLVVTDDAYHLLDPADGSVRRTVTYENAGLEYLGIDKKNGVLSMEGHNMLYGYRLPDGELLYEETLADGVTAVCNKRFFYAVASTETDSLLFYQMGEEDVYMMIPFYDVNGEYLETMFFSAEDDELYLVYKDGTVRIFFVDWNETMAEYFFGDLGSYTGFPGKMERYETVEGENIAFLCGDNDAYQIVAKGGQRYSKYAQIRGFLAYDAASKTLYLHNGDEIYTSPLYDTDKVVNMGSKVLQDSSYWNYPERWPWCLSND